MAASDLLTDVHKAAKDGHGITLFAMLCDQSDQCISSILNQLVGDEEGQSSTPLIIASKHGHDKLVKTMLIQYKKVKIDMEKTGTVKFDGYTIEGATALWCAAGAGHLKVVEVLVQHGADVNHATASNSTPLRAACFDGRIDIVKYLLEHGADLTITNNYQNTCLMIACYKGHFQCVAQLLKKKSDPNLKAHCGATALLFAAEMGHLNIVKELVKYGAKQQLNDYKVTPLIAAAENGKVEVVNYFIGLKDCATNDQINALELLGATFANDKTIYSTLKAFHYLQKSMLKREEALQKYPKDADTYRKKILKPIAAYKFHIESQSMADLEKIKNNVEKIHMEALSIRERILTVHNPDLPHQVVFRGAVYADDQRFEECILLWLHAMRMRRLYNRTITKDLLRFAQVFAQMHHTGHDVSFDDIKLVLEAGIEELKVNQKKIKEANKDDKCSHVTSYESNILSVLYLLVIATKVKVTNDQIDKVLYPLTYKLIKMNIVQPGTASTWLHLVVDQNTSVDNFHISDVVKLPSHIMTRMLCMCGAKVNAVNSNGDTPLHVIVKYDKPISDFHTLHATITTLIEFGAHVDMTNKAGKTPIQESITGVSEIIIKTTTSFTLKCLAAQVVKKFSIPYVGNVPIVLEEFVEMH